MRTKVLTIFFLLFVSIFFWHCAKDNCEFANSRITIKYNSADAYFGIHPYKNDTIPFEMFFDQLSINYNFNYDVLASEPLASNLNFSNPFDLYACPPSFTEYNSIHQIKNIIIKTMEDINDSIKSGDIINSYLFTQRPISYYNDTLFTLNDALADSIHFFHSNKANRPLFISLELDSSIIPKNKNLQLTATFTFDDGTTLLSDSKKLFIKD